MTAERQWLVDKSAYARLGYASEADDWAMRINRGLVQITTATLLEIGYAARSADDWSRSVLASPATSMPVAHLTPAIERRALDVQGVLARRGQHRAPSVPDLLIAATAELAGLVVLHLDKDFELISEVTGQETERLRVG